MQTFKALMMLLGLVAILLGLRARYRNRMALGWPSVKGTIIRSELQSTADGKTRLDIAFRYTVAGRPVDSRPVVLTIADIPPAAIQKILRRLATGRRVRVYYDPDKPESATVDHASAGNWVEAVVAGAVLIAFAAFAF